MMMMMMKVLQQRHVKIMAGVLLGGIVEGSVALALQVRHVLQW